MSKTKRASIVSALVDVLKEIDGTGDYSVDLVNNVHPRLKFWSEVLEFPYLCVVAGQETREYKPAGFTWGFINVAIKIYCKSQDDPQEQLEDVLGDVENRIRALRDCLEFGTSENTSEINVISIITDEGLLAPYAVGEILLTLRYQVS